MKRGLLLLSLAALAACAPKRVHEEPILENGDRVPGAEGTVASVQGRAAVEREEAMAERDSLTAEALADCVPSVCAAIARGEVALGMDETQVLAATATTPDAWSIRQAGRAAVMVPAGWRARPHDAAGELAMVQFRDGRVSMVSYRDAQGVRVIDDAQDATTAGRADAMAERLIREGDEFAARGDLDRALDRYDRASVLRAGDPLLDYRIATVLDKQLRPIEALIRYRLFLHRLELEKIEAVGDAYAKLADAIAHARERVIILEKNGR
ncbi:MAG TPA: hypothetical protein VF188_17915 [Longimicrobiales bacterium]